MRMLEPARLRKLRAMSPAEIASRASYAAFLALERRSLGSAPSSPKPAGWQRVISDRRRPPFFPSLQNPDRMRQLFAAGGPYAGSADRARRAAEAARQHTFGFFGQEFSYGPEIDWHADPVTRRGWPKIFHRDVPIHTGSGAIGDVKYVWELNRHQFLIDLGKTFWLFGDRDAASALYRIVRSWIGANPYGRGVNWSCALEPAFRVWSWLWAYSFCLEDQSLDDETRALWLGSFCDHGRFLHRHLEYYASPYNHLAGEAAALYALGLLFPEMPGAARWRRRGRGVLLRRLDSQFHVDGGTVEQSTFYHHATLGFYILAASLADTYGEPFPARVHASIEKAIEFSMCLIQPDGHIPSIGGADDGKCIRLEHLPFWDFRPFQAFGAVRYGRSDFRFAAGEFFEDALWLLGPAGRDRFLELPPAEPARSAALPASGYYIVRSGWHRDADYLCFDCGPQAAGLRRDDVPSAAHGHADCLSAILWLRGRPVLVDPGFHCYNGDPAWEVHFRRTRAHNTAQIDGLDQSRHVHKMAWSRVFAPRPEAFVPGERGGAAAGSHDGYSRIGVTHRRAVWLHETGICIICDQFTGTGSHDIEINYQFAPGVAALGDATAVLYEHAELAWTGTTALTSELRCGGAEPHQGWIAPSLGRRVAAPRLTLKGRFQAPVSMYLTVALPRLCQDERRSIVESQTDRLSIGLRTPAGDLIRVALPIEIAQVSGRELLERLDVRIERGTSAEPEPEVEHCG